MIKDSGEVWLSSLKPDEVGQPYIDVRAHRAYWESLRRTADLAITQLNSTLLKGDLGQADAISRDNLKVFLNTNKFFLREYNLLNKKK